MTNTKEYFDIASDLLSTWTEMGKPDGGLHFVRYLRTDCPECGSENPDEDSHGMFDDYVLIGCEGYLVMDPNLLGIPSPNWTNAEGEIPEYRR